MTRAKFSRFLAITALTSTVLVGGAQSATAADLHLRLRPGLACPGFGLQVDAVGGNQQVKEFLDANGNTVRTITTGTGTAVTLTNVKTKEALQFSSNGATTETVVNPDGTQTVTSTGHLILILFPTDVPAGPTTTLIVGRVVYTVDSRGVFRLQSISGQTTDLCALLG